MLKAITIPIQDKVVVQAEDNPLGAIPVVDPGSDPGWYAIRNAVLGGRRRIVAY